jgi:hypothetical protein
MTSENLIRVDNGGDQTRFPWLGTYRLSKLENQLLSESLRHFQVFTDGQFPEDVARQSLLARIVADKSIAQAAPGLNRLIEKVRADLVDGIYVTNLPTEKSITNLLSLTLSSSIGSVFNYGSPNSGRLVMELASDPGEPEGHSAELDWRTEGAWVPRDRRAEWIVLLGVENTQGSYTAYAPIMPVEQTLSSRAKAWLHSPSASFRSPRSSATDPTTWSAPRAILSRSPVGHTEIAWPGDAVRAARADDAIGASSLAELSSEIGRHQARVSIDAGCFLAFNNLRGVHRQAMASDGYCLCYKTYARHSLRALQVKGESGPIFSLMETGASRRDLADSRIRRRPRASRNIGYMRKAIDHLRLARAKHGPDGKLDAQISPRTLDDLGPQTLQLMHARPG